MSSLTPRYLLLVFGWIFSACGGEGADVRVADSIAEQAARPNQPPVIESLRIEPQAPVSGEAVRAIVEISDADSDPVQATYEWEVAGKPAGGGTSKLVLRDVARGTRFSVSVRASDGRAESAPLQIDAAVHNSPPEVDRLLITPGAEVTLGQEIRVEVQARDRDADEIELSYRWELNGNDAGSLAEGAAFPTTGLSLGDQVRVEVRAYDGSDDSEVLASPLLEVTNRAPRVVSRPGPPAPSFSYQIEVEDPDGDLPSFELSDPPSGMRVGADSGLLEWDPTPDQTGTHRVQVLVDDQRGGRVVHAFDLEVGGALASLAEGRH